MPRTLNSPISNDIGTFAFLYEVNHSGGVIRMTNASFDIIALGFTWTAVGGGLIHGGAPEASDRKGQGTTLSLSGVSQTITDAIRANEFRGQLIKIYLAHLPTYIIQKADSNEAPEAVTFSFGPATGFDEWAQGFTAIGGNVHSAKLPIWVASGTPTGDVVAKIYSVTGAWGSTGKPNALLATSDPFDVSGLSGATRINVEFLFTGADAIALSSGDERYLAIADSTLSGGTIGYSASNADEHPGDLNRFVSPAGPWQDSSLSTHDGRFELYMTDTGIVTPDLIFQGRQNNDYKITETRDHDGDGGSVIVTTRISADTASINTKMSVRTNVVSHEEMLRRAGIVAPDDKFFFRIPSLMGKEIWWGKFRPDVSGPLGPDQGRGSGGGGGGPGGDDEGNDVIW